MIKTVSLFMFILAFSLNQAKAIAISNVQSDWNFWALDLSKNVENNSYYVNGYTGIILKNDVENSANLVLNINANPNINFLKINNTDNFFNVDLYIKYYLQGDDELSIGYEDSFFSKESIKLDRGYNFKSLDFGINKIYSNFLQTNDFFINDAQLSNNHAFGINYKSNILEDKLKVYLSFIPSLKSNISTNHNSMFKDINNNFGAVDGGFNYYNEYEDLGYGIISGIRVYESDLSYKGNEFLVSANLDYLGLGIMVENLTGNIQNVSPINLSYNTQEISLYYSLIRTKLLLNYLNSNINNRFYNYSYKYRKIEAALNYKISRNAYFNLNAFLVKQQHFQHIKGIGIGTRLAI